MGIYSMMKNNFITILPSDTIGDSLSSVNLNYLNLELNTLTLQMSADEVWEPMYQFYEDFSGALKSAISASNAFSNKLDSAVTNVETNSSKWIKPLVYFYPTIFSPDYSVKSILQTVSAWVQENFPVIPASYSTVDSSGNIVYFSPTQPDYVEGQNLFVYAHSWVVNSVSPPTATVLTDSTHCTTFSEFVCTHCSVCYYGGTYCGTDTWVDCGGRCVDCSQCENLHCYYNNGPYTDVYEVPIVGKYTTPEGVIRTDSAGHATASITASISMQFQDVSEMQRINAFQFTVQNCTWVINKSVPL